MAITKAVRVTVQVHNRDAVEYVDDDADQTDDACVTKYIEAISGATFSIKTRVYTTNRVLNDSFVINVKIDGQYASSLVMRELEILTGHSLLSTGTYETKNHTTSIRPWKFAQINEGTSLPAPLY